MSYRTRVIAALVALATVAAVLPVEAGAAAAAGPSAAQPAAIAAGQVGSYSGQVSNYANKVTFYVSSNRKQVQDVSDLYVRLTCTPGGTINAALTMAAIPLGAKGSFAKTTTQQGVYDRYPVTFTSTFRGSLQRADGKGPARGAGTLRVNAVYTDSVKHTCTTGDLPWSATKDAQPAQTTARPPVGSYTAQVSTYATKATFYVSSSRTKVQDVADLYLRLSCTAGGAINVSVSTTGLALADDGSFAKTTTQQGVYDRYPATFTTTFRGNFHGVGSDGAARAVGTLRLTAVYTDSAKHTCTTNDLSWSAARDTQPTQTAGRPPAGSYTAQVSNYATKLTFRVSAGRTELQSFADTYLRLSCSAGGAINMTFSMAVVSLAADGSFGKTTSQPGTYQTYPATITSAFRGNFHGVGSNNAARAAGTLRLTVVYTDSAQHTCTTNDLSWTGLRTGN